MEESTQSYCSCCGCYASAENPVTGGDGEGGMCRECWKHWKKTADVSASPEPRHVAQIRRIATEHQAAGVRCPVTKKVGMVDAFSASAIIQVYDAINEKNRDKFVRMAVPVMAHVAFGVLEKSK